MSKGRHPPPSAAEPRAPMAAAAVGGGAPTPRDSSDVHLQVQWPDAWYRTLPARGEPNDLQSLKELAHDVGCEIVFKGGREDRRYLLVVSGPLDNAQGVLRQVFRAAESAGTDLRQASRSLDIFDNAEGEAEAAGVWGTRCEGDSDSDATGDAVDGEDADMQDATEDTKDGPKEAAETEAHQPSGVDVRRGRWCCVWCVDVVAVVAACRRSSVSLP